MLLYLLLGHLSNINNQGILSNFFGSYVNDCISSVSLLLLVLVFLCFLCFLCCFFDFSEYGKDFVVVVDVLVLEGTGEEHSVEVLAELKLGFESEVTATQTACSLWVAVRSVFVGSVHKFAGLILAILHRHLWVGHRILVVGETYIAIGVFNFVICSIATKRVCCVGNMLNYGVRRLLFAQLYLCIMNQPRDHGKDLHEGPGVEPDGKSFVFSRSDDQHHDDRVDGSA